MNSCRHPLPPPLMPPPLMPPPLMPPPLMPPPLMPPPLMPPPLMPPPLMPPPLMPPPLMPPPLMPPPLMPPPCLHPRRHILRKMDHFQQQDARSLSSQSDSSGPTRSAAAGKLALNAAVAKPAPTAALVTRSLNPLSASMSLADIVALTRHASNEDGSPKVGAGAGGNSTQKSEGRGAGGCSLPWLWQKSQSSAYFQQIEADVVKHADAIWQAKADLEAFQTTDFDELVSFRAKIEALLQDLTDETQVLQRFEGFPSSKLELLRASASLHSRLSALSRDLLSAVPMSYDDRGATPGAGGAAAGTAGAAAGTAGGAAPASVAAVGVCLDRCERLFDRVRREVEAVERSREEDAKKFAAQRLPYSGGAIERVKAAAVRLSSRLLELSAQESMKLRASVELVDGRIPVYDVPRVKAGLFLLWRCFQFAFRAYNFAGGQDETAEELSLTVAKEMEAYPAYMWG
ncbi:unnamed protein product [Closterium sp. Naga37s-1]|nr:unnamed protein product [Closterium sp. Naga37s-1]